MVYGRVGDQLYLHGAIGNAMLRRLSDGIDVCVTVTIVDAHVLSRSAFHHSMNYRSVVVVGEATLVEDRDEKHRALRAVVDHNLPGRSDECRGPNESELRATRVIRVPITEASAKVRSGPPIEEPEDLELPYWGGEVPLVLTRGTPVADEFVAPGTPGAELRLTAQSKRVVARSAPARSDRSFSQTTDAATSPIPADVSNPQSVPAMMRRGSPTASATRVMRSATTSGCST